MNIIETKNLTKCFGNFFANDNINLTVKKGEIKSIVGENGAGKTTLMNMLYGLLKPTSGEIAVNGQTVNFQSPIDAIAAGLGMVHQHFKLVPSLTVYENVLLGIEKLKKVGNLSTPIIDERVSCELVQEAINKYKLELNAKDKIENISMGAKQRVEILKMLYRNVDILILDEPTAVLTPQEVDEFTKSLKELKAQGKTIIIITHKLQEVMAMSDSITVIKHGKIVGELITKETSKEQIAQLMVGRDVVLSVNKKEINNSNNPIVYKMDGICTNDFYGKEVLSDISLYVREGEVLGIAGVEGNGQSELMKVVSGLMESTKGKVEFCGENITNIWPKKLREKGIGIVSEDRFAQGLCAEMSIADNLIAGYQYNKDIVSFGILNKRSINKKRDTLVKEYDIRVGDIEGNVGQLSGGNAQKVVIAKEFNADPKLLVASQPTRGVDIGSIEFIHNRILDLRSNGKAVLLISSELSEIMSLSDRIAVMYKGKIIGEVVTKNTNTTEIGLLMAGIVEKRGEINEEKAI